MSVLRCAGLDPSGYRHAIQQQERAEDEAMLAGDRALEAERFSRCDRFTVSCPSCGHENVIDGVFVAPPPDQPQVGAALS